MRLEVQFRHMDRSETLEEFAIDKISAAVEEFVHRHDAHVQIWLISDVNRTNRGTGQFTCEIDVRYPKKRDLFISKSNEDMQRAIIEASDSLSIVLDEAGKREKSLRRESISTVV